MENLNNIIFLLPEAFYGFILLPVLLFLIYRTKNFWNKFKFVNDLKTAFWNKNFFLAWKMFLLSLIFSIFILLLANPNKVYIEEEIPKNWIDIEIVLDISFSTLAKDVEPNRIEAAKTVIWEFAKEIEADRLWLIVFARKAFNVVPLTFDYETFNELASEISVSTINQAGWWLAWTNIWDSILAANESFTNEERERVIILISDGSHNIPEAVNPLDAVKYVREKWVKVYTIWIWDEKPVLVPEISIVVDPVDEKWLKAIAELWGWKYFRAKDKESLKWIFDELIRLEKTESSQILSKTYKPYYLPFVILLFFAMTLFISLETLFNYRD